MTSWVFILIFSSSPCFYGAFLILTTALWSKSEQIGDYLFCLPSDCFGCCLRCYCRLLKSYWLQWNLSCFSMSRLLPMSAACSHLRCSILSPLSLEVASGLFGQLHPECIEISEAGPRDVPRQPAREKWRQNNWTETATSKFRIQQYFFSHFYNTLL